jgi:hypothetical protein
MEQITHLRLGDQLNVWWAMLGMYPKMLIFVRYLNI